MSNSVRAFIYTQCIKNIISNEGAYYTHFETIVNTFFKINFIVSEIFQGVALIDGRYYTQVFKNVNTFFNYF